jgi:hypothetical protein
MILHACSKQGSVWRRCLALARVCVALGWTAIVVAQGQEVLRNADIVKMTTAQLSPETIVLKIETSTSQFDTSPDALSVLKAAGVAESTIAAMIRASAKTSASPTPTKTALSSVPATDAKDHVDSKATVYIYRPGKFVGKALEPSVFLDEQKLLDMDNARYLALKLEPGRHILRSNEKNSEIDQTWDGGKTYYIKMTIATGMMKGHGQMGMVTDKLALREMEKLRPLDRDNVERDFLPIVDLTPVK